MGNLENNESDKNSPALYLGEYLKQKRLEKNFSLEKLSQKTKISINILKCLEINDFDNLPSAAYIKGFVTSYVKVLGLPIDEAISKMEYTYQNLLGKPFPALNHTKLMAPIASSTPSVSEKPKISAATRTSTVSKKPVSDKPTQSPHDMITSSDSLIENTKSILPIAIFASVILLFIGGYKLVSSIVEGEVTTQKTKISGPRIETSSALVNPSKKTEAPKVVPEEAAPAATTPAADTTETGSAPTTAPVAAPATTNATGTAAPATTPVAVEIEKKPAQEIQRNFPFIAFNKIKGGLFNVKNEAPETGDPEILPEEFKSKVNPALQNVYIRATDGNTWMSYKIDNNPISSVIISQGNGIFLQGSEIRMFLGNVNVTKVFYNNNLIETPNKAGVKSLIFPEENSSKYLLPLFPKAKDDIFYTAEEYVKRMKMEEEELGKKPE